MYSVDLVITASSDRACKLWTLSGKLVGLFGQKSTWDIRNEATYAHFNPFEMKNDENENILSILGAISTFQKLVNIAGPSRSSISIEVSTIIFNIVLKIIISIIILF
jgi:hypothetical protein